MTYRHIADSITAQRRATRFSLQPLGARPIAVLGKRSTGPTP